MAASAGSWSAPSLLYWEKPDGTMVAVDEHGTPLDSPPHLKEVPAESLGYDSSVGPLVIDQWGRVVVPYHPPGSYGVASDGMPMATNDRPSTWPPTAWPPGAKGLPSSCPTTGSDYSYESADYRYWIDPSTGEPVLVQRDGLHAVTPPGVQEIDGKVVDQWGNEITSYWPEQNLGISADGSPLSGSTIER
jgi:hypothetical protein